MRQRRSIRPTSSTFIVVLLLIITVFGVVIASANDLNLGSVTATAELTPEETAYYEYVAPRLDRLVAEVDDVAIKVEGRSRDIIALTISGKRIEELAADIGEYGRQNGVPPRFADVHASITHATGTATNAFTQAREALSSFDFSRMSGLVSDFTAAAHQLHVAQGRLESIAGGTNDA